MWKRVKIELHPFLTLGKLTPRSNCFILWEQVPSTYYGHQSGFKRSEHEKDHSTLWNHLGRSLVALVSCQMSLVDGYILEDTADPSSVNTDSQCETRYK
jgi:hypothetical protein